MDMKILGKRVKDVIQRVQDVQSLLHKGMSIEEVSEELGMTLIHATYYKELHDYLNDLGKMPKIPHGIISPKYDRIAGRKYDFSQEYPDFDEMGD